jgi:hypothetical protein
VIPFIASLQPFGSLNHNPKNQGIPN